MAFVARQAPMCRGVVGGANLQIRRAFFAEAFFSTCFSLCVLWRATWPRLLFARARAVFCRFFLYARPPWPVWAALFLDRDALREVSPANP